MSEQHNDAVRPNHVTPAAAPSDDAAAPFDPAAHARARVTSQRGLALLEARLGVAAQRQRLLAVQQLPAATREEQELREEVAHLIREADRAANLLENYSSDEVDQAFRAATGDPFTHYFMLRRAGRPVPADLEERVLAEMPVPRRAQA